jgi:single-strand DNA-binding protein
MAGVNRVILVGNVGRDPEVRTTPTGQTVAKFSLATSEKFKDRSGEKQERTDWHNLVAWGNQADFCRQYIQKGRQIYVEGRLRYDSWTDPQGQKKYRTEIIIANIQLLGSRAGERPGERPAGGGEPPPDSQPDYGEPMDTGAGSLAADDDLPF